MEPIVIKINSDEKYYFHFMSALEHHLQGEGDIYVPYKSSNEETTATATVLVVPGSAHIATLIHNTLKDFYLIESNKGQEIIVGRGSVKRSFKKSEFAEQTFLYYLFPEIFNQSDSVTNYQRLQKELSVEETQDLRKLDEEVAKRRWDWVNVGVIGFETEPTGYRRIEGYDELAPEGAYERARREVIPRYSTDAEAVRDVEGWIKIWAPEEYIDTLLSEGLNADTATPEQKCRAALNAMSWISRRRSQKARGL